MAQMQFMFSWNFVLRYRSVHGFVRASGDSQENVGGKCLRESVVMYYYGVTFEKQQLARTSEKLHGEEFTNLCSKFLILFGYTNSGAGASTFHSVAPDIYRLITAVFFPSIQKCQLTCTKQKVRFTGHSRIVGPLYESYCMPPFCRLEFGGGS